MPRRHSSWRFRTTIDQTWSRVLIFRRRIGFCDGQDHGKMIALPRVGRHVQGRLASLSTFQVRENPIKFFAQMA